MNKSCIALCAFAFAAISAGANVLTPEEALGRLNVTMHAPVSNADLLPRLVFTQDAGQQPACYVFARGTHDGFMVLSADDAAPAVLGYSETGTFDAENIPSNMAWWLGEYAREIEWMRGAGQSSSSGARYNAPSFQPIAPLLTTFWDQGAPYNDYCPANSSGRHAYTGCVATAMAQMMKYHNYPAVGQGYHTYGFTFDKAYTSLTVNFEEYHFDWDAMINSYTVNATAQQKKAVAELMYCCGVSVDMNYGTSSSGAQSSAIPGALIQYFKFDKACHSVDRNYTTYGEWINMIYNDLKNVGPVVYGGQSNDGGHAFVCDGYDKDGYFHINWGWGGMSDGYFRLTALDPDSQGIGGASAGFNYDQHIVLGAQPAREGSKYVYSFVCGGNFTLDKSDVSLGRSVKVTSTGNTNNDKLFWNASSFPITGTIGLSIISSNGTSRYVAGGSVNNLAQYAAVQEYSVTLPTDLAAGTYTVVPAWKVNNGRVENILVRIPCIKAYKMVVTGSNAKLTPIVPAPTINATSVQAAAPLYAGKRAKFRVTFANPTDDEFYSQVAAGLFKAGTNDNTAPAYAGTSMMVDVEAHSSMEYDYLSSFGKAPAGDYVLYFYDPDGYKRFGQGYNVTVEAAPSKNTVAVSNFRLKDNATTVANPENIVFEFDVTCTAGLFDGALTIGIIQGAQTYWRTNFSTPQLYLFDGDSESLSALGSFTRATKGTTYNAYIYDGNNKATATQLAGPVTFTVVDPSGIADITADDACGEAVYYTLQGVKVQGQPAPGHYIKVAGGKAEHVIVK